MNLRFLKLKSGASILQQYNNLTMEYENVPMVEEEPSCMDVIMREIDRLSSKNRLDPLEKKKFTLLIDYAYMNKLMHEDYKITGSNRFSLMQSGDTIFGFPVIVCKLDGVNFKFVKGV